MKGFDILKVKSAVKSRNKMDLSKSHLTTLGFSQILPLAAIETVPGDEFNVNAHYFSRLAPLVTPTYGKFAFRTVSAYVPYHMIAVDAEAWIAGKTTWEGYTTIPRFFTLSVYVSFLTTYCLTTTGATSQNAWMKIVDSAGTDTYYIPTDKGKYYIKLLNALGYALPSGVDLQTSSSWQTNMAPKQLNAFPLLAFLKLYNDYMSQSQRFNTSVLTTILNAIKYRHQLTNHWNYGTGAISAVGLYSMISEVKLNYDNDYFTSAWQTAQNPINSVENVASLVVPAIVGSTSAGTIEAGPNQIYVRANGSNTDMRALSQRALDFLKSFDNWVRRNNYSGSRAVQQVYSRFGIKTSDYREHYAHIISTDSMPVQVGDVTATADINNTLGDYCGKGVMNGNKAVSLKADDYGMFFILGYFAVVPMNPYGFDRSVLRMDPLEYYQPEFDGLGADAISVGEYYTSPIGTPASDDDSVFGYTERYNSYRYGRDMITGDFRNFDNDNPMNAWHTGRNLSALRDAGTLVAQSAAVNTMDPDITEYNRIFSVTSANEDKFYLTCQFDVEAVRPMLNLNQVVNLGEGDTNVPRNGNVIS